MKRHLILCFARYARHKRAGCCCTDAVGQSRYCGEICGHRSFGGWCISHAKDPNVNRMLLRVAGPNDYLQQQVASSGELVWAAPAHLQDGQYSFEVELYVDSAGGATRVGRETGTFSVSEGVVKPQDFSTGMKLSRPQSEVSPHPQSIDIVATLQRATLYVVSAVLNAFVPNAHADVSIISDSLPAVIFDDTDDPCSDSAWVGGCLPKAGHFSGDTNNLFAISEVEKSRAVDLVSPFVNIAMTDTGSNEYDVHFAAQMVTSFWAMAHLSFRRAMHGLVSVPLPPPAQYTFAPLTRCSDSTAPPTPLRSCWYAPTPSAA